MCLIHWHSEPHHGSLPCCIHDGLLQSDSCLTDLSDATQRNKMPALTVTTTIAPTRGWGSASYSRACPLSQDRAIRPTGLCRWGKERHRETSESVDLN